MSRRASDQRGTALLLVLWALLLLGGISVGLAATTRSEVAETRSLAARAEARAAAEAALWTALGGVDVGALRLRPGPDGAVRLRVAFGGREFRLAAVSESGKVDLNAAGEALLGAALAAAGVPPRERAPLVAAIVDWRDRDDAPGVRGAEAAEYRRAGSAVLPRNAPFESIDELRGVRGMSETLFRRLAPFVTVHAMTPSIDPRFAEAALLQALGAAEPAAVRLLLQARALAAQQGLEGELPPLPGAEELLAPGAGVGWTFAVEAPMPEGSYRYEALVWLGGAGALPFALLAVRSPGFAFGERPLAQADPAMLPPREGR